MPQRAGMKAAAAALALLAAALVMFTMIAVRDMNDGQVDLLAGRKSAVDLARIPDLVLPAGSEYSRDFPESYLAAAPNPNSRYAWVCPGPSRLDDVRSEACPESSTGGFRCCVDTESGGAVTDNMCCPKHEKSLVVHPNEPSTGALERKFETILTKIVNGMEKAAEPKPQPEPHNYISAADADSDLSSYFDKLSDKPAAKRSMATLQAKTDLNKFFSTLGDGKLGGLATKIKHHKVQQPKVPDASKEIREYAEKLALKMKRNMETEDEEREDEQFREWRKESIGRKPRMSRTDRATLEQKKQQERARRAGEETAKRWGGAHERYFTDVRGPVSQDFLRDWNPSKLAGRTQDGEVVIPEADVHE